MYATLLLTFSLPLGQFSALSSGSILSWSFAIIMGSLVVFLLGWSIITPRSIAKGDYGRAARCIGLVFSNPGEEAIYNTLDAICFAEKAGDYPYAEKILARAMKGKPTEGHHFMGVRLAIRQNNWAAAAERLMVIKNTYGKGIIPMEIAGLIAKTDKMIEDRQPDEATIDELNLYKESFEKLIKNSRKIYISYIIMTILTVLIITAAMIASQYFPMSSSSH
jgi:hypothetical protein